MAVGVERPARKAASRLDQGLLLSQPLSEAMSNGATSITSGVGLAVLEHHPSIPRPTERVEHDFDIQSQTASPSFHLHQPPNKKRRSSTTKSKELRRSSSTPHMRNLALTTSGELSPTTDKRRNKLGYHRTSVACVHCRRRKIRCLVANDDLQGRCANCIRLKKECKFYPVEQTPEQSRSQSNMSKDSMTGTTASSGPSPPHHPPPSGEKMDEFRNSFSVPSSHPHNQRFGMQAEVDIDPHQSPIPGGGHVQHSPYAYPHPIETQWHTPGFLPSSTVAEQSPSSAGFWRPSPSAPNSVYGSESNVSGGQTPATMSSASNMSYGRVADTHNWAQPNIAPPTRSMSYGNIEGLPQQYSSPSLGVQHHDYPRRTSPYPYPTVDTAPALHSTTLGSTAAAPLSAPILPNQHYGYPTWQHFGGMQHAPQEMQGRPQSAQWNNETGRLDRVQEENAPPVLYSQHPVPPFYSGS